MAEQIQNAIEALKDRELRDKFAEEARRLMQPIAPRKTTEEEDDAECERQKKELLEAFNR